jgi:hypothetical protein
VKIFFLTLGLACAGSLCGQHRFSWQDACFNNPAAPYCAGHDYAIKPPAKTKKGAPGSVAADSDPVPSAPESVTPSVIVVGGINWRFADPLADAIVGVNASGLSASPLARRLVARLGAGQGIAEADLGKIFDGLSGVYRVALSVRNNRSVFMITRRGTDLTIPPVDAGWKAVTVGGNAMLVGHADAVDQAAERIAAEAPLAELARLAEEWQADSEFWAVGSAAFLGPQAVGAGIKRFSMAVSIRDRFTSSAAFEFDGVPDANTLQKWPSTLGAAMIDGHVVHVRTSLKNDEVDQSFGQIAVSPLGERLATLVKAAQFLPGRDNAPPKSTKPVIYGLDSGPKQVK